MSSTAASIIHPSEAALKIDIALVAVVLATLFALIKRTELMSSLTVTTVAEVYRIALIAIVDKRLSPLPSCMYTPAHLSYILHPYLHPTNL